MRYVIMAINLLLVVWIASQLASLTWSIISPGEEAAPEKVAAVRATSAQADADRRLIGQLPGWNLLGEAPKQTAPVKTEVPADAPDTRLKLTLRGALASDNPENARAIIADPSGRDEQYAIGDAVPGNAELSEIFPDRVILKRSGRYETLRLPEESSRPAAGVRARQSQRRRPAGNQRQGGNLTRQLQNVREQLRSNPQSMAGMLRVSPHTDDSGSVIGYALSPGRDPAMFEQLGLVEGDVVIEVNDMAMSDPNNGAQALAALRSGQPVTVKLLRNGQEQIISLGGL